MKIRTIQDRISNDEYKNEYLHKARDKIHDTSHWLGSTSIGKGKMSKLGQMEKEVGKMGEFPVLSFD